MLETAQQTLRNLGKTCNVSAKDLEAWFKADTPYPDISLDEVLRSPWLVIHEIVEIDSVKRKGLMIAKDTILKNLALVDEAHFEATVVEIEAALRGQDSTYLRGRVGDLVRWAKDPRVQPEMKRRYRRLLEDTERALININNNE